MSHDTDAIKAVLRDIEKAIDRLTEAVKALVPGPCGKGMYTAADNTTVRCALPLGHHGQCDSKRRR